MRAFYSFLLRIEAVLAGALLVTMVAVIFFGGVARMMGSPMNWTIDLATCCFAWATFLCADIAWRRGLLMSIDTLVEKMPRGGRRALRYFNLGLIAAFLAYLVYQGVSLTWTTRARTFNGIPGVSYSWVTASLPVGAFLMLVTTILKVRETWRGEEPAGLSAPPRDPDLLDEVKG